MIIDVEFEENDCTFEADFGETQTVHGKDGTNGKSAFEIALEHGFEGTEADWVDSLHGTDGYTPAKGVDYFTEDDKTEMVAAVIAALPVYDGEVIAE